MISCKTHKAKVNSSTFCLYSNLGDIVVHTRQGDEHVRGLLKVSKNQKWDSEGWAFILGVF